MSKTYTFYARLKRIPQNAYHEYCLFYKTNKLEIAQLDFMEYVEIKYDYIKALYFIDEYALLHKEADILLEEILNDNHFDTTLKSFYTQTIFWKARAFLNNDQRKKAIVAYKELVKIAPEQKRYRRTLFSLLYQENYLNKKKSLSYVVLFLLISLVLNAFLILFFDPFYPEFQNLLEMIRNGLFTMGLSLFLALQARQLWAIKREIKSLQ